MDGRKTLENLLGDMEDYVASWIAPQVQVRESVTEDTTYLDIVKRDPPPALNKTRFSIDEKTDDASSVSSPTNSRSSSQSSGTSEPEKKDEKKQMTAWKFGKKPSIERKNSKQLLRTQSTDEIIRVKKNSDPLRSSVLIQGTTNSQLPPRPSSVNITKQPLSPSTVRKPPPPPSSQQLKLKATIEQKKKEKQEIEERLEITKILKIEAAEKEDYETADAFKSEQESLTKRLQKLEIELPELKKELEVENMRAKLGMKRPEEVMKMTLNAALTSEELALQEESERRARLDQSKFLHTDMPSKEYIDSHPHRVNPKDNETPKPKQVMGKAIYNYSAVGHLMSNGDHDISITKGQLCIVVSPPIMGWVKIESNGVVGLVPESYIETIQT